MIDRAKQQRPQAQTVDELVGQYDTLLAQLQQTNGKLLAERGLRTQMAEIQRELLERQRRRNQQDFKQGRDLKTMSNTPLPPYAVQEVGVSRDLDSMR